MSSGLSGPENKTNAVITVAWIGFAGAILAAIISAAVILYSRGTEPPKVDQHFTVCIKIERWAKEGSQPIIGASVQLDLKDYRYTTISDNAGCASFDIPNSIRGQRGTITVTTADGRTKTLNEDIRDSSPSIIFYPND